MVKVTLFLSQHIDWRQSSRKSIKDILLQDDGNDSDLSLLLILSVNQSRVLWNSLIPCLFGGIKSISKRALLGILNGCFQWDEQTIIYHSQLSSKIKHIRDFQGSQQNGFTSKIQEENELPNQLLRKKIFHVAFMPDSMRHTKLKFPRKIALWIQPPQIYRMEYTWQGLLIRWEHLLIQAQSFTGYLATLGGGFFLCHHFQTAVVLAKQQQRLAVLLNDESMYYSCILNQAYNFIYAGYFSIANRMIREVLHAVTHKMGSKPNQTLIKMCFSARLFSKRMRKASQSTKDIEGKDKNAKTIDDFARIRVVHRDQSKHEDLIIPFQKRRVY